jgi:hypothetical protein
MFDGRIVDKMETGGYPTEVTQAIRLYRAGKQQESRDRLRDFLLQQPGHAQALLWLARVTPDPQEAVAAAELALKLDPSNEVAQRAVVAVRERTGESPRQAPEQAELSAAVTLSTGMTLAQARAVTWPFRNVNRPIGEALDDGAITLHDLGWALENARECRIRDAVRTILLTRLVGAEPKELPGPMRVVVGSRFSEQQERKSVGFLGFLLGAGAALLGVAALVGAGAAILQYGYHQTLPWWFLFLMFGVLGSVWILARWSDRYGDQADQYRTGRWGEEKVVDVLRYSLDSRWTLFRNFEWPNRKWGDIDLILVGPGGVWVFETKAYSGQIRNVGDRWERRTQWRWRRLTTHPGLQARRNAARLNDYLRNKGVRVPWVEPVVAWAGEQGSLTVEDPATPVWSLAELTEHSEELWQSRDLPDERVRQVVDVLDRAVQEAQKQR